MLERVLGLEQVLGPGLGRVQAPERVQALVLGPELERVQEPVQAPERVQELEQA